MMWAIEIWPSEPCRLNSCAKNTSRLMPMITSGVTIGSRRSVWTAPAPRNRSRASPSPRSEPRIVAPTMAIAATWRLIQSASISVRFDSSLPYQSRENPSQTKLWREALKLNTIRTTIGANRNA